MSETFRSVLADRVTIRDYAFAITLIYLGYDLVKITRHNAGSGYEFDILVPKFDLDDLRKTFDEGTLSISDARALGEAYKLVGQLASDARRSGCYVNPDFRELLRDETEELAGRG